MKTWPGKWRPNGENMKNAKIKILQDEELDDAVRVRMSGDLTIDNIPDFMDRILTQLNDKKITELIVDDVDEIDLAFYQFLLSISKTCKKQGLPFSMNVSLSDDQMDLFVKSGFDFKFN